MSEREIEVIPLIFMARVKLPPCCILFKFSLQANPKENMLSQLQLLNMCQYLIIFLVIELLTNAEFNTYFEVKKVQRTFPVEASEERGISKQTFSHSLLLQTSCCSAAPVPSLQESCCTHREGILLWQGSELDFFSIFVFYFRERSSGRHRSEDHSSKLLFILIDLLHSSLNLLSLYVQFPFMLVDFCISSTIHFYSHFTEVLCVFFPAKNGCSAAFELVITDLKGKIYWLVFSLLFGIVHVQLVSADVF